jgi:hypothetical protein
MSDNYWLDTARAICNVDRAIAERDRIHANSFDTGDPQFDTCDICREDVDTEQDPNCYVTYLGLPDMCVCECCREMHGLGEFAKPEGAHEDEGTGD